MCVKSVRILREVQFNITMHCRDKTHISYGCAVPNMPKGTGLPKPAQHSQPLHPHAVTLTHPYVPHPPPPGQYYVVSTPAGMNMPVMTTPHVAPPDTHVAHVMPSPVTSSCPSPSSSSSPSVSGPVHSMMTRGRGSIERIRQ